MKNTNLVVMVGTPYCENLLCEMGIILTQMLGTWVRVWNMNYCGARGIGEIPVASYDDLISAPALIVMLFKEDPQLAWSGYEMLRGIIDWVIEETRSKTVVILSPAWLIDQDGGTSVWKNQLERAISSGVSICISPPAVAAELLVVSTSMQ